MSVVDVVKGSISGMNGFEVVRGYKSHVMNDVRNKIIIIVAETPMAKARWVLEYLNFQIYSKEYKTNLFFQDFY